MANTETNVRQITALAAPPSSQPQTKSSFTDFCNPGEWPPSEDDLPMMFTQHQYAHLRRVGIRILQKERRLGTSPVPWVKVGKNIWYPKADVIARHKARGV
jgi:hypothetical protein